MPSLATSGPLFGTLAPTRTLTGATAPAARADRHGVVCGNRSSVRILHISVDRSSRRTYGSEAVGLASETLVEQPRRAEILPLPEAISRTVGDGSTVALEGFTHLIPFAAGHEILRQGRTDLTLVRMTPDILYDQLIGMGSARRLVFSWGGNPGVGSLYRFRDAVEHGWPRPLELEEHSHAGMANRYAAGASGLPFAVMRGYAGSDLVPHTETIRQVTCPFTGELLVAVPALVPDVALIHVHTVDALGNAQVEGPTYMDAEYARAANTVIVTAEEVVPSEAIVRTNDRTLIPGFEVDAVVEVPYGSYPHECHGRYEADFDHFDTYTEIVKADGAAGVREYIREYVEAPGSFSGMLDMVGVSRLLEQRRRARELVAA